MPSFTFFFFLKRYTNHRDLHSFPTRRSSDLDVDRGERLRQAEAVPGAEPPCGRGPRTCRDHQGVGVLGCGERDRKSTRLNSSHVAISYAVFCLKKKNRLNYLNRTFS